MNAGASAKSRILSAAAAVVARSGAAHLTIDAVAAEAKLSKGGVLYHFPSKRAMLEGMLEHVMAGMNERSAMYRARLQDGRNSAVRSLILSEQDQDDEERAMSLAILAAAAEDPELLDPAREVVEGWFAEIGENNGCEPEARDLGVLLLLATEGLRFLGMLDLLPMQPAERERIHQRLLSIAEAGAL